MGEIQRRIERDNDRRLVHTLKALPWEDDADINGADLVELVSLLVMHPERTIISPLVGHVIPNVAAPGPHKQEGVKPNG